MNNYKSDIQLSQLAQELCKVALEACFILEVMRGQRLKYVQKSANNLVSEIDFIIQIYILKKLKKAFPNLLTVGQEDLSANSFAQGMNGQQYKDEVKIQLPSGMINGSYGAQELCLWVDPLDNTFGLLKGSLHQVTILLGVTYLGHPILGVIAQPYGRPQHCSSSQEGPCLVVGGTTSQHVYEYTSRSQLWTCLTNRQCSPLSQGKVIVGFRKYDSRQRQAIKMLHLSQVKAGGAGYKALSLIRREVDSFFLMGAYSSKWDTCAAEAIIRGMGGYVCTPSLQTIDYNPNIQTGSNVGFLMTLNQSVYTQYKAIYQQVL